ncbi:FMRFamide receptor [Dirofilaria immitis]
MLQDIYPVILRYSYPLARIAQTCGVYLTLFVSVHRYLGVCHPFQAKRWITGKPVKCAIFGSILFSFIINSTTWLELTVVPCYSKEFHQLSRHIQLTELQMDYMYGIVMKVITYTLVMFIFPFLILIIVNTRIILALKHSSNMRALHTSRKSLLSKINNSQKSNQNQMAVILNQSYASTALQFSATNFSNFRPMMPRVTKPTTSYHSSTRDSSVTLMLLAIVAMFLTCNGLAFCNNIIEILIFVDKIDSSENESAFEKSVEIANILVSLNSATSIFIYLIFSSKYRLIVKEYLGLKKVHKAYGGALTATSIATRHTFEYPFFRDDLSQNPARLHTFTDLRFPISTCHASE